MLDYLGILRREVEDFQRILWRVLSFGKEGLHRKIRPKRPAVEKTIWEGGLFLEVTSWKERDLVGERKNREVGRAI